MIVLRTRTHIVPQHVPVCQIYGRGSLEWDLLCNNTKKVIVDILFTSLTNLQTFSMSVKGCWYQSSTSMSFSMAVKGCWYQSSTSISFFRREIIWVEISLSCTIVALFESVTLFWLTIGQLNNTFLFIYIIIYTIWFDSMAYNLQYNFKTQRYSDGSFCGVLTQAQQYGVFAIDRWDYTC